MAESSSGRRVAVVVVAGVGDGPRTDAACRVANGLAIHADFDALKEHSEWYKTEETIEPVQRFRTSARSSGTEVDIYEFWWADLSRFPAAMRSFLAAFVGLFLAFPSIGRTALRDARRVTEEPQPKPGGKLRRRIDFHLLGLESWLLSVPIVVLSATLLMIVGAVGVAIALPKEKPVIGAVALSLYGAVLAAVGLWLLHQYERRSGRSPARVFGFAALGAALGVAVWRVAERGTDLEEVELALADTVTIFIAYPLRLLWLGLLLTATVATIVLAARLVASGNEPARRGRTLSAVITLGFGPLGLATLMAILSAAVGAALGKVSEGVKWTSEDDGVPFCLERPASWRLTDCPDPITALEFGTQSLEVSIFALVCASAIVIGALLVLAAAAVVPALFFKKAKQARRVTHILGVLEHRLSCPFLLLAALVAAYAAAAAWLPFLPLWWLRQRSDLMPTLAAILGGSFTTLTLAARLMGISPRALATDGKVPGTLRTILDKPYDIATFLREPSGIEYRKLRLGMLLGKEGQAPRKRMLRRYSALIDYLDRRPDGLTYDKLVFAAHSQGTILTTTLLADPPKTLPPRVALMTFGCPLRQLYLRRFPSQYQWVAELRDEGSRSKFVKGIEEWVNVAAPGDPIGRTIFDEPPEPWAAGSQVYPGEPALEELRLAEGGHTSYWDSQDLYERLARMIEG